MTLTHKPAVDDGVDTTTGNDEARTAPWRWLLRFGITPYLVGTDAIALLLPLVLFHQSWARTVLVVTLCIGLVAAGGLYRPRLTLSALDDGIAVAARVVIAFAVIGAAIASVRGGGMSATELQVLAAAVVTVSIGRAIA